MEFSKQQTLPIILTSIWLYNHLVTTYGDDQQPKLNTNKNINSIGE